MPELPEVETVVRGLRELVIGRTIEEAWYDWRGTINRPSPEELIARIAGQSIVSLNRRAKYIVFKLNQDYFVVHLKMTGRLYVAASDEHNKADNWVHFKLRFDNGQELRFSDVRKFGKVYLVDDIDEVTGKLGPEPLEDVFTVEHFQERLKGRSKVIKTLLLDQSFIAGVGNIYADEALFRAGIHPKRGCDSLSDEEIATLYSTVRAALLAGIQHEGASINWYRKADGSKGNSQNHFFVYGRTGKPCKNCGHIIEKTRVAQRGTHYCPVCQPKS